MRKQNKEAYLIFLFISILLFSELVFTVQAQTDKSLVYQNQNYVVIENITLKGAGTGVGLTLKDCSHVSLYNVHIENFAIGIKIEGGLANNIYNPQLIYNTEIGLLLTGDYGVTRVFGGSITANGIGIKITDSSMMNLFYGVEIEVNIDNEVTFGDYTYGNLFEGCYFERTDSTSDNFFDMTNAVGTNTFYANKFATQGTSKLEVFGNTNIFKDNIFDSGLVSLSIHGTKNVFRDSRQGLNYAEIILIDAGTETQYQNNFFIADNLPQLPSDGNLPQPSDGNLPQPSDGNLPQPSDGNLPQVSSKNPGTPEYSFPTISILFLVIAIVIATAIAIAITLIATVLLDKKYKNMENRSHKKADILESLNLKQVSGSKHLYFVMFPL
jgi:hypothetical protein